jgi:hypothetical protein
MEFEAPPCQSIKRAATAPVEGQEATRLAGGRTGDGMTFYDGRPRAASACEVGDCGTDRATTANHDVRAQTHSSYLCQSWLPSSRAALVEGEYRAGSLCTKSSNNNNAGFSGFLEVGGGGIFLKFSAWEGPISCARSCAARSYRRRLLSKPIETERATSAAQVDQKRRYENRERRLICVQPKESVASTNTTMM